MLNIVISDIDIQSINNFLRTISPLLYEEYGLKTVRVVLDTSIVLSNIRYSISKNKDTALAELLRTGVLKAFAPEYLETEVYENAEKITKNLKFTKEKVIEIWLDSYKPYIEFVDVSMLRESELLEKLRDPKDSDFVKTYEIMRPDFLLTKDIGHLVNLGIAPSNAEKLIIDFRAYALSKSLIIGLVSVTGVMTEITVDTTKKFISILSFIMQFFAKKIGTSSKILWTFILILIASSLLSSKIRKSISRKIGSIIIKLKDPLIHDFFCSAIENLNLHYETINKFEQDLPPEQLGLPTLKYLKDYIFHLLMYSDRPMDSKEIANIVLDIGYQTKSESFNYYVTKVLRKSKEFIETDAGWVLKN